MNRWMCLPKVCVAFCLCAVLLLLVSCVAVRPVTTRLLGEARVSGTPLPPGKLSVPGGPRAGEIGLPEDGPVSDLIREWASREIPDWESEGKVTAPRVLLAKLATGTDIVEVNRYLVGASPWAKIGSTWGLRPNGDYDFSLPPLTAILHQFGDTPELLYPETRGHLLSVLLNQDGPGFETTVPGSLRLVAETENHILMTEGSRYLKNQWLVAHGETARRFDNAANGLEDALVGFINELDTAGLYEFNSTPYIGYTLMALLTLEAFANPPVADAARASIDRINYEYALGSLQLRRYAAYRRQRSRRDRTDLADHPHTSMMRTWVALAGSPVPEITTNTHQAIYAALMPYRLPQETVNVATQVRRAHYVRIGRGEGASPEIYSAGDRFLISAGGTGRPERSQIVARPVSVMLADHAGDVRELITAGGDGPDTEWNNSGVLPGVAIARPPISIPAAHTVAAEAGIWTVIVDDPTGVWIVAGETPQTAILYVLGERDRLPATVSDSRLDPDLIARPSALARWFSEHVSPDALDRGCLSLPDGRSVTFDLDAAPDTWVISSVDGVEVPRNLTAWPRLSGWVALPPLSNSPQPVAESDE